MHVCLVVNAPTTFLPVWYLYRTYSAVQFEPVTPSLRPQHGCLVVNAPTANTVAAAEHGIALLCALSRYVPQVGGAWVNASACVLARQGGSCCAPWRGACRRWAGAWVNTECVCLSQAGQELLCALARYVPQVDGCVG